VDKYGIRIAVIIMLKVFPLQLDSIRQYLRTMSDSIEDTVQLRQRPDSNQETDLQVATCTYSVQYVRYADLPSLRSLSSFIQSSYLSTHHSSKEHIL
jgi:hypothetical protein